MPFQSKDSKVLGQQLKVQEIAVRFADKGLYSASGSDVTVDLSEAHTIVSATHHDNSGPTVVMIAASAIATSSTSSTITLGAAFAANDVLVLKYIVTE